MADFDYVIIGNGAAGVSGVEGIRRIDTKGTVAVIGDEDVMPYSRCYLTGYISGRYTEKNLTYRPLAFYEKNQVKLTLGRKAVGMDPAEKRVLIDDGSKLSYGKLLLATGSSAMMREVRGRDLPGVHLLRTIKDAQAISSEASSARSVVVMGGGLVGIGLAIALHERGLEVHQVVASPQVLSQNLDRRAADLVAGHLRKKGIDVRFNQEVVEVLGEHRVNGARLADGSVLECQMVVSAKGVRMNTELASGAGLMVGRGVVVDEHMRTSAPDVFAAGDVAEAKGFTNGKSSTMTLWPVASEQGRVAGMNMAGGDEAYAGSVQIIAVEFFGMPIASIGEAREPRDLSGPKVLVQEGSGKEYRRLALRGDKVVGATMVGEGGDGEPLIEMPCTRIDARKVRGLLLKESLDFEELADALMVKRPRSGPGP